MSTNSECQLIEIRPNKWYYILEDYGAPLSTCDWRENATAYGPFGTAALAETHLSDNHANPGGWSKSPYPSGYDFQKDSVLCNLIKNARK